MNNIAFMMVVAALLSSVTFAKDSSTVEDDGGVTLRGIRDPRR